MNLFNKEFHLLRQYLNAANPDFLVLLELTPEWAEKIKTLETQYPYAKAIVQKNNFGIGIISKFPLENAKVFNDEIIGVPFLVSEVMSSEKPFYLIAAHPFPPLGSEESLSRNSYFSKLSKYIQKIGGTIILCGDLNVTPWSRVFSKFVNTSGLVLPTDFGIISTWPTFLKPLAIPVDHCLTSRDVIVSKYQRGPHIGSDHYPLEMDFHFKKDRLPGSTETR